MNDEQGYRRRTVLRAGGATLGGLAVGSVPAAAERPAQYLVKPKRGADLSAVSVEAEFGEFGVVAVRGRERDVRRIAIDYAPDPVLELAEPKLRAPTSDDAAESRDEPLYELQWDKRDLSVPEAHDVTRGDGVRVAVIDSGIAATHPDLDNVNLELSKDFSGDGLGVGYPYGGYHGTHVSGIIAANDENDEGVVGTAPGAELVDCRVFPYGAGASFSTVLSALLYSVAIDADVANLSLGAYAPRRDYVDDGRFGRFYGRVLNTALTYAQREGTLVVMSAGNNAADLQHDKQWISLPNEGAKGLSVSATGPIGFGWGEPGLEEGFDSPAFYTNYGTNAIDLGAPGGDADLTTEDPLWFLDLVLSTVATFERNEDGEITGSVDYSYGWAGGTSMAAPNVSGAAALVKANNPEYAPAQVASALERAAAVPDGYDKAYYGSGYLNVLDAL